jgi:putative ABC transport system permease protein
MRWYQRFFRREVTEKHLDAELRFHLEHRIADLVAAGMAPEKARRQARLEFGGLDQVKEECRDVGVSHIIETFVQDLRYGLRQLRRNPGFAVLAVLALALGLGANTAIFSLAEAVLFPPFAGTSPARLAAIYTSGEHRSGYASSSYPDYLYYREHSRMFSAVAAFVRIEAAWTHSNTTDFPWAELVSSNYFHTLGVKPVRGRFFLPSESYTAPAPVAVVSYQFWREHMASMPQLESQPLMLNGNLFTVVGVAPKGFEGVQINWGRSPDFWLPMSAESRFLNFNLLNVPDARFCLMVGRLRRGVTLSQAANEIRFMAGQLERVYPQADKGRTAFVLPFNEGRIWPAWREKITGMVWILGFFAGLVLLVACADVANLFLARGSSRQKEIGVRLALGASRVRIMRHLLTESMLVSLAGAGLGLLLARWLGQWITQFRDFFTVRLSLHPALLDERVFAFTLILAILTAVGFGLAPAFQVSHVDLNTSLKESSLQASAGGRHQWVRHSLVVAAVSIAFVAAAGAAILLHTLWALDSTNLGLDPRRVLSVNVEVFTRRYKPDQAGRFYSELLRRLSAVPGVESSALAFNSPLTTMRNVYSVQQTGTGGQNPQAWQSVEGDAVSQDYFATLRIPLLSGRDFRPEDSQDTSPVVIVNRTMARTFWPHEDPIGRQLLIKGETAPAQVIGIVGDVKQHGAWGAAEPFLYRPFTQSAFLQYDVLARARGDPMALLAEVRQQVTALDPQVPVYGAQTLEQVASDSLAEPRMAASLVSLFGVLVLFLAVAGIYGVISYWVVQRTHEIGIRVALGAEKKDILTMVINQGLKLALIGVAIGVAGALVLTRFLSSLLYGVKPVDLLTFIAVALILVAVALIACYIPARRATKVDPMVALRYE